MFVPLCCVPENPCGGFLVYLVVRFILVGQPKSTQHCYKYNCRGGFVRGYMDAGCKALKEDYQWQLKSQYKGAPLEGAIEMEMTLYFGTKRKADIDNYNKLVLDALTGIVYVDDEQIVSLKVKKAYDKSYPRILIHLSTQLE